MKKLFGFFTLALACVAVLALGAYSATAARHGHGNRSNTFIENNCKRLQQKPRHIDLACGKRKRFQDDRQLRKVRYRNRSYGNNNTRARANLHVRGVTNGRSQVKLRFKNLKRCTNRHAKGGGVDNKSEVYRKVTIRYRHAADVPAGSPRRWNKRLGCG